MQTPNWLKPGLHGVACGAVALAIVGFSWGGWVTGGMAKQIASNQARTDTAAALSLICEDQAKRDPQMVEKVAALKSADSWKRSDLVMTNGWATMPGSTEGNRQVA